MIFVENVVESLLVQDEVVCLALIINLDNLNCSVTVTCVVDCLGHLDNNIHFNYLNH